jgi:hypothetical protein
VTAKISVAVHFCAAFNMLPSSNPDIAVTMNYNDGSAGFNRATLRACRQLGAFIAERLIRPPTPESGRCPQNAVAADIACRPHFCCER